MQQINVHALKQLIDNPSSTHLLLDVREPNEFAYCHIPDSQSMPMQSIPAQLEELPKDISIITICHHGMRSQQVANFLLQNGFSDILNLTGGVHAWACEIDSSMPTY